MSKNRSLITPVILAGGKGTRLWPMSRASRPKQFLRLTGDNSLFQETLLRLRDPELYGAPIVITNSDYRFLVAEQALECAVNLEAILLEPVSRNTAAAIAAACLAAARKDEKCLVHILPSDHEIQVDAAYLTAVNTARKSALAGNLVTFGIAPTEPTVGFGYIEVGDAQPGGAFEVNRFVEKPDAKAATKMVQSGNFCWNSGMFMFSAQNFLDECKKLAPKVFAAAKNSVESAKKDLDFIRLDEEAFTRAPDISVDYAIFEKTSLASVVPAPLQWSDLGSWDAVWKAGKRDDNENFQRGPATINNTSSSLIVSEKMRVVVNGLNDIAVIASEDALYVGRLSLAQNVGEVVKSLNADPQTSALTQTHPTSYRPWGGYSCILIGERFQVKRLFVKPGKSLSLQKHHHRSEHWVVVRGTAEVQLEEKTLILSENEGIYIPQGTIHRLSNPGKILLELIEVQTGSYLGEDDIVRLEDEFGRI